MYPNFREKERKNEIEEKREVTLQEAMDLTSNSFFIFCVNVDEGTQGGRKKRGLELPVWI